MFFADTQADVGRALVDYKTPVHFGVGFFAGALGMNPHVAALLVLAAKAGKIAVKEGLGHALYGETEPQSYGNEMMDLLMEMTGILAGMKTRSLITGQPVIPVHGLGDKIVGYQGNTWYQAAAGAPQGGYTPLPTHGSG